MEEKITQIRRDFDNGVAYQNRTGIIEQIRKNIRFYEGRQWEEETENTRTLPRPVTNYIKMIVRNKKAGILSSKVKLSYSCNQNNDYARKLTRFNESIEAEMDMETIREKLVEMAMVRKSAFIHYYWDADAVGELGEYKGGVRAEIIDPRNIFFANPCETDEQKQKWIIIVSRVDVNAVKEMASDGVDKELIHPDELPSHLNGETDIEQEGSDLVTVYTRYFRKNGEVFFERGTANVMLHEPIALTPNIEQVTEGEDSAESNLPDEMEKETTLKYRAKLYPILAYQYDQADRCIYGLSEVEGLIPNQKIINLMDAMQTLAIQGTAWPKFIVSEQALKGQKITNQPGQVLVDHTPNGPAGQGIKTVPGASINGAALTVSDLLAQKTRVVSGASEAVSGEVMGKNQSGDAIAQLQAQALKPIDDLKETFWKVCERGGKIIEQFYKLYYEDKAFSYMDKDEIQTDYFNGAEILPYEFTVKVEAGAGSKWSEALLAQQLERLLSSQLIDFSTYIELYPETAMPYKATLQQKIAEQKESENAQLRQQVEQATAQIKQLQAQITQASETIKQASGVIAEVDKIKRENDALKIESTYKLLQAAKAIQAMAKAGKEVEADAGRMAKHIVATDKQGNNVQRAQMQIPSGQGKNPNNIGVTNE